jgi:hypothetical protein
MTPPLIFVFMLQTLRPVLNTNSRVGSRPARLTLMAPAGSLGPEVPMRRRDVLVLLLPLLTFAVLAAPACGGGEDEDPLAVYAGSYPVTESYVDQSGTQCGTPPDAPFINDVRVGIDGNELELVFDQRWGTLRGQVDARGAMNASGQLGASEALQWTGHLTTAAGPPAELQFSGQLRDVTPACTRSYAVSGSRPVPE